jgi:transcriptional regulator with XRE-family HTH domain
MNDVSNKLLTAITEAGHSYKQLSKLTGVPSSSLQRYATGRTKKIPIDLIRRVGEATGKELAYFIDFPQEESPRILLKQSATAQAFSSWCSPNAKLTLIALHYISGGDSTVDVSANEIAEVCGFSKRTALRTIQELERAELIGITPQRRKDGGNDVNAYRLMTERTNQ